MRLSLIFELLLIFVLLAFAASRVIDSKSLPHKRTSSMRKSKRVNHKVRQDVNNYCNCSSKLCNCCRDFNFPVVSVRGPGCATLQYLKGDKLAVSLSFGERVLSNTTISGRKPKPVCMQLPGGVSKFCGRVYGITREGDDFKACLGLELRSLQDLEASLRVSCFRFGPKGLKVEPPQPLPILTGENNKDKDEDEDDDDDDDDDDDEYDFDDDDEYDVENDVDGDYAGFSVFDDDFVGDLFGVETESDGDKIKKPKPITKVPVVPTKVPLKAHTSKPITKKTTGKPAVKITTAKPISKVTSPSIKITPTTLPATSTMKIVPPLKSEASVISSVSNENFAEKLPSESIAAVTAMLQNVPEVSHVKPDVILPTTIILPTTVIVNEVTDPSNAIPNDDEDESSTEVVENLIIKDGDEDPENDDDEEEEEEDDDPISEVVEDVLEEGSDSPVKNKTASTVEKTEKVVKQDSEDVVDEIVDGMMDTFTGGEVEESKTASKKPEKLFKGYNKSKHENDEDDEEYEEDDDDDEVR